MDIIAIIEHNKLPIELIEIHRLIDGNDELNSLYSNQYPKSTLRRSQWDGPYEMTAKNLIRIWDSEEAGRNSYEELEGAHLNYYAEMSIPWAKLTFHRKTIVIHIDGYGNLRIPKWASFILKMNRAIADIFNSSKIVYCVDSYAQPELIYDKACSGMNLDDVINYANNLLGVPPKEINKAINNLYFIDEFDLNIDDLVESPSE